VIIDINASIPVPDVLLARLWSYVNGAGIAVRGTPPRSDVSDSLLEELLDPLVGTLDNGDLRLVCAPLWALPTAERRAQLVWSIAEQLNDLTARYVQLSGGRLAGLGAIPQTASMRPRDACSEMIRCVNDLRFVGFKLNPDPGEGGWEAPELGSDYWFPIYEQLVELDVPAIIEAGSSRFAREQAYSYVCQEESVAAWALLRSARVWEEFPTLKLVIAHGGGYIPYQYGRGRCFRLNQRQHVGVEPEEEFEETLARLYFDTVLFDRPSLELLLKVCKLDRCMYGSGAFGICEEDFDDTSRLIQSEPRHLIESIEWLSASDRRRIFFENARQVFTRLPRF